MTEEAGARQASQQFEERAALLLTLRQAGLRDLSVLRAIEATPREAFAPYRFRDLANRNLSLPIGCGQTMSRPVELARRLDALKIGRQLAAPGQRTQGLLLAAIDLAEAAFGPGLAGLVGLYTLDPVVAVAR